MSTTVIKTERLGKRYAIGQRQRYRSLRDSIVEMLTRPGQGTQARRSFWALKDLDLEVRQGERLGIIGRNGAGKTTLLKILSDIAAPTEGRVRLHGRVGSLLEVGTGFHPELTGRENVFLNGAILGMSRAEIRRKFDEIVAFAEIQEFLDTPVKHYSSGMSVRLGFAVAAHLEPEILLVDEVLAVGDVQFQRKCLQKMRDVAERGRTVLFVSHNMAAVRSLCDRAILLAGGMLTSSGEPKDVIEAYTGNEHGTVGDREWADLSSAPQNTSAVINRIALRDSCGGLIDVLYTDKEFDIEIEFTVKVDGASVGLTTVVNDAEGNCLFGSINNHEPNWYGKPMQQGDYRSVCTIPANLLNSGRFRLDVILFGKGFSEERRVTDALRFEIVDGVGVRGDYFGEFKGWFRPKLEWITHRGRSRTGSTR